MKIKDSQKRVESGRENSHMVYPNICIEMERNGFTAGQLAARLDDCMTDWRQAMAASSLSEKGGPH